MTRFYFIRHATHGLPEGALPGRSPGVFLSPEGEQQATHLAERMASVRLDALYSSPLERTRQTAEAVAARQTPPLNVQISEAIHEINYGAWTGKNIPDLLQTDPTWAPYNTFRSGTQTPGGESIFEIQGRSVAEVLRLRQLHGDGARVALVSHADTIRGLMCHFLGMPVDFLNRLLISPASVSVVDISDWGPQIVCIGEVGRVPQ